LWSQDDAQAFGFVCSLEKDATFRHICTFSE
jgi:hypothetical protein